MKVDHSKSDEGVRRFFLAESLLIIYHTDIFALYFFRNFLKPVLALAEGSYRPPLLRPQDSHEDPIRTNFRFSSVLSSQTNCMNESGR